MLCLRLCLYGRIIARKGIPSDAVSAALVSVAVSAQCRH